MKTTRKTVSIILTIIAFLCIVIIGVLCVNHALEDKRAREILEEQRALAESMEAERLAQEKEALEEAAAQNSTESGIEKDVASDNVSNADAKNPAEASAPPVPNPYADSFLANEDMAAWLQIPDTNIDYPVMWTPRDENYYLRRGFDGKKNSAGCLILDTDSSLDPLTTNLIIHGHNMRAGTMFAHLKDYEDSDFYENHKQIILHTKEGQRNYEVIAVFRSQVYKKSDTVFKFYKFFQADTEEEFEDFYQNIKSLALYDTGVTAEFGDRFITLSTCSYHVDNGRLVVVAKETEPGNKYLSPEESVALAAGE